nr:DUF6401 family natural product biosynthesis protein [Pseudonocardia sp. H11422]
MFVLRDAMAEWSARRLLRRLTDQFGQGGLSAAEQVPGLAAAIDQHAAAVRDILREAGSGRGGTTTLTGSASATVCLAAYARSLVEQQRRGGGPSAPRRPISGSTPTGLPSGCWRCAISAGTSGGAPADGVRPERDERPGPATGRGRAALVYPPSERVSET